MLIKSLLISKLKELLIVQLIKIYLKKIGVTEYLSSKCKVKDNSEAMLIYNRKLSVCPHYTHLDLKEVSKKIKKIYFKKGDNDS